MCVILKVLYTADLQIDNLEKTLTVKRKKQEKLVNDLRTLEDGYRNSAVEVMSKHEVDATIQKAHKSPQDAKLLQNIHEAYKAMVANGNSIVATEHQHKSLHEEKRARSISLSSLKADQQQKADKVDIRPNSNFLLTILYAIHLRKMLTVVTLNVLLRGCAQIMSKASHLKRHRLEAALTAYKAKVSTRTLLVQAQRELSRMRNEERASEENAQNSERSAQVKHTDMHTAFFFFLNPEYLVA